MTRYRISVSVQPRVLDAMEDFSLLLHVPVWYACVLKKHTIYCLTTLLSFLLPLSSSFPPTPSLPLLSSLSLSPLSLILPQPSQLVRTLLEDLPGIFANNRSIKCALGAALQAAEKLLVREKGSMNYLHIEKT